MKVRDVELWNWIDTANLVMNSGRYEFPIYSATLATYQINDGESFIVSTGTVRQLTVRINSVLCSINFNSSGKVSGTGLGDRITDTDGNTGVFTEFTSDENIIRFYSNGVYVAALNTAGLSVAAGFPIVMEGLGGDTYRVYNATTQYIQWFLNGAIRMEI